MSTKHLTWARLKRIASLMGVPVVSNYRDKENQMVEELNGLTEMKKVKAVSIIQRLVRRRKARRLRNENPVHVDITYSNITMVSFEWAGNGLIGDYEEKEANPRISFNGVYGDISTERKRLLVATRELMRHAEILGRLNGDVSGRNVAYFRDFANVDNIYREMNPDLKSFDFKLIESVDDVKEYNLVVEDNKAPVMIGTAQYEGFEKECGLDAIYNGLKGRNGFKNLTREALYGWFDKVITEQDVLNWCFQHNVSVYVVDEFGKVKDYFPASSNVRKERTLVLLFNNNHVYNIEGDVANDAMKTGRVFYRCPRFPDFEKVERFDGEADDLVKLVFAAESVGSNHLIVASLFKLTNGVMRTQVNTLAGVVYKLYAGDVNEVEAVEAVEESDVNVFDLTDAVDLVDLVDLVKVEDSVDLVKVEDSVDLVKVEDKRFTKNGLCANVKQNSAGSVTCFQFGEVWVVLDDKYEQFMSLVAEVERLNLFGDVPLTYTDTSIAKIVTGIYETLSGVEMPKSFMNKKAEQFMTAKRAKALNFWRDSSGAGDAGGVGIDVRRCYTAVIMRRHMPYPVYSPRDQAIKYVGGRIRCGGYKLFDHVKTGKSFGESFDYGYIDCETITDMITSGYITKDDIEYYLKPTASIEAEELKRFVRLIYSMEISDSMKKDLVNVWIGTLGRTHSTMRDTALTTSLGVVERWERVRGVSTSTIGKELYMLSRSTTTEVLKHNMPINIAIVQGANMLMLELNKEILTWGQMVCVGCRTDCLYYTGLAVADAVKHIKEFNDSSKHENGIGDLRIEKFTPPLPKKVGQFTKEELKLDERVEPVREMAITECESMTDEMAMGALETGFKLEAKYAGGGKTWNLLNVVRPALIKQGFSKAVKVMSTSHRAVLQLNKTGGWEAVTIASHMGMRKTDFNEHIWMKRLLKFEYYVVDEYNLEGYATFIKLYELWRRGVKFIFAGAENQLPSIDNMYGSMRYGKLDFFNEMCGHKTVRLTGSHRLNEAQMKVHDDCETGKVDLSVYPVLQKWMPYNLCYTNKKRVALNKDIGEKFCVGKAYVEKELMYDLGKTVMRLCVGSPLVCKSNDVEGLCNNLCMTVEKWGKEGVRVITEEGKVVILTDDDLLNCKSGHALTTHSVEGATLEHPLAVHELERFTQSLALTALSRNRDNKDVFIARPDMPHGCTTIYLKDDIVNDWKTASYHKHNKTSRRIYGIWNGDVLTEIKSSKVVEKLPAKLISIVWGEDEQACKRKEYKIVKGWVEKGVRVINHVGIDYDRVNAEVVGFAKPEVLEAKKEAMRKDVKGFIYDDKQKMVMLFIYHKDGKEKKRSFKYTKKTKKDVLKMARAVQSRTFGVGVVVPLKKAELQETGDRVTVVYYEYSNPAKTKQKRIRKRFNVTKKRNLGQAVILAVEFMNTLE